MELIFHETGQVTANEHVIGRIAYSLPEPSGSIELDGREYGFRLFGPFGQGYNLAITERSRDLIVLSYNWRDGTEIEEEGIQLDMSEDGTTLSMQGRLLASNSWTSNFVRVRVADGVARERALVYSCLIAIDRMFADKVGIFRHRSGRV